MASKTESVSRRQFLQGSWREHNNHISPPWADALFSQRCSRCESCITACPEGILEKSSKGLPIVNFQQGECTFCGYCAEVCSDGALKKRDKPWSLQPKLADSCLLNNQIDCRRCVELCEPRALKMSLSGELGRFISLNSDLCSGCGGCVQACPVSAINMVYSKEASL